MRVVVAPNAYKSCMDSSQAAEAMRKGIQRVSSQIEIDCIPVADGGDSVVEVLAQVLNGSIVKARVSGPLNIQVDATFCHITKEKTAIVEMAKASGLGLLTEDQYNPEKTSTFGTGELISQSLDLHVKRILVGLGGSATCDGGIGAAAALGYRFLDKDGVALAAIGGNLSKIRTINLDEVDTRIQSICMQALCDVNNPLTGLNGAAYVYAPQKGADPDQVERLDLGLKNLAAVIKKDLGIDIEGVGGAGAAGGLGGGLFAFFGAELKKGGDLILDIVGLKKRIKGADLVLTGEGQIDHQTQYDKAPAAVARLAKAAGVPCVAICGSIGDGVHELYNIGIDSIFSISKGPQALDHAISRGAEQLSDTTEQIMRLFLRLRK